MNINEISRASATTLFFNSKILSSSSDTSYFPNHVNVFLTSCRDLSNVYLLPLKGIKFVTSKRSRKVSVKHETEKIAIYLNLFCILLLKNVKFIRKMKFYIYLAFKLMWSNGKVMWSDSTCQQKKKIVFLKHCWI